MSNREIKGEKVDVLNSIIKVELNGSQRYF